MVINFQVKHNEFGIKSPIIHIYYRLVAVKTEKLYFELSTVVSNFNFTNKVKMKKSLFIFSSLS